ncbi:hypothetical protein M885DRAFT_470840 [Pelagophyceae sp. CCMP2097]|nr:hypothetical protein M885DRAFT_470840 [Pelagophyceae sp. CCMP2097]
MRGWSLVAAALAACAGARQLAPLAPRARAVRRAVRGGSAAAPVAGAAADVAAVHGAGLEGVASVSEAAGAHAWTAAESIEKLKTDVDAGLSPEAVASRRAAFGANKLVASPRPSKWQMLKSQFDDRLVQILVAVAVASGALGVLDAEDPTAWVDPVVIMLILASNAAVGVWQESSAESALDALEKLQPERCCARRNSEWDGELSAADLVPGDVVYLRVGDKVPADVRLLQLRTSSFSTDEAALTGESMTVQKCVDPCNFDEPLGNRECMLFASTVVTAGNAVGVVTATGMATEMGRIQAGVTAAKLDIQKTPLALKLDEFAHQLTIVIGTVCAATFAASVPRFSSPIFGSRLRGCLHYAKGAVALGVAAIPEGLPAVITLCLSLGTRRMAQRNVVVRRLQSVETLGCTTVICSDKTGTLTTNQMTAVSLCVVGGARGLAEHGVSGLGYDPSKGVCTVDVADFAVQDCIAVCSLANDAQLAKDPATGDVLRVGEPTEAALRVLAEKCGTPPGVVADPGDNWRCVASVFAQQHDRVATLEFDRNRKSMSVLCRKHGEAKLRLYVKGAPDSVLQRCTALRDPATGRSVPLTKEDRLRIEELIKELASRPLRCIALATRDDLGDTVDPARLVDAAAHESLESGLTLCGVVGIRDPPRPEAKAAIARCKEAGVRVFMITGDSRETAVAIASELGILDAAADAAAFATADAWAVPDSATGAQRRAFEGNSFFADPAVSDARRAAVLAPGRGNAVFCRTAPADKQRIIKLLADHHGDVTAMTGDGVNDAPALQQASIGIAMGITGTEVAKQAADMVLMDDDFASIVSAVEEGRAIYKNMQAFVCFLLSCNFGEVATIFGGVLLGVPDILSPLQLLWINLVTDGPPATALGFNPPDPDSMQKPPRKTSDPILTPWLLTRYAVTGTYVGCATIGIFCKYYADRGVPLAQLADWTSCSADAPPGSKWSAFRPLVPSMIAGADACHVAFHGGEMKATAQTLALTTLVAMEMLKALSAVSLDHSLLRVPFWANPFLCAGVALPCLLHLLLLKLPALRSVFGLAAITGSDWADVFKFAAPILLVEEALKATSRFLEHRELAKAAAPALDAAAAPAAAPADDGTAQKDAAPAL